MKDEKVVLLVLKSGENLLGLQTQRFEDVITLKDIVAFAPKPDGKGVMTIPYLQFSSEDETTFDLLTDVRHALTPNADLQKYYDETFNRIVIPETKLITPTMMGVD